VAEMEAEVRLKQDRERHIGRGVGSVDNKYTRLLKGREGGREWEGSSEREEVGDGGLSKGADGGTPRSIEGATKAKDGGRSQHASGHAMAPWTFGATNVGDCAGERSGRNLYGEACWGRQGRGGAGDSGPTASPPAQETASRPSDLLDCYLKGHCL
jgi:hypothetical protein